MINLLIYLVKKIKGKTTTGKSSEELQELLDEIEVKDDKEKDEDKVTNNKIVDPELIKLKEKLLSKKRKKIDKFYGGNQNELEESLEKRLNKENDDEDEYDLISKINKITNRQNKSKVIKPKITQNKNNSELKDRRILANKSKLASTKFK